MILLAVTLKSKLKFPVNVTTNVIKRIQNGKRLTGTRRLRYDQVADDDGCNDHKVNFPLDKTSATRPKTCE
jgi:hypothetical protein